MKEQRYLKTSELAKELSITYQGALKKLRSNADELKKFLVYDTKGNIKGIKPEGLEHLRNLPHRVSYVSKQQQEYSKREYEYNKELEYKDIIIKEKQVFIDELLKDKEELKARVNSLEAELEAYKKGNFITRLLSYRK